MFSGEISKNGKDGWAVIEVASLEALQAEHSQSWTRKSERIKKVRKLDTGLFSQFFTKMDPPSALPSMPSTVAPTPSVTNTITPSEASPAFKNNSVIPVSSQAADAPPNPDQLAKILLKGFRETLEGLGHDIGTELTQTIKADLMTALDVNSARLNAALGELAQTIGRTNFESHARALAEKFLEDLRAKAESILLDVEKSAGKNQASAAETRDDLEKLRGDLEARLQSLRHLQGDVSEDSADLVERIKKFGLGHVQVLEQRNEQLLKELEQSRVERSRLHSELTQEKLARGAYDPALFQKILKENAESSTAKVELDRARLQLANAEMELADLRPLRTVKLEAAQNTKELSELREWKKKYHPELQRETDRAKVAGEEIRRLETDQKNLKRSLRELEDDRRNIQELKETSESYKNKANALDARLKKLESSEAKALEKVSTLEAQVSEGRDAYKREIESEHSRQMLLLRLRHGEELDKYVKELDRQAQDISLWRGRAEQLDSRIKQIEEDDALGLRERYQELLKEYRELLAENAKRKQDIAHQQAELAGLSERVKALRHEVNADQQKAADFKAEVAMHQQQLDRYKQEESNIQTRKADQRAKVFRPVFDRVESETQIGEWEWLLRIQAAIKAAGFHFNSRLVHAFHTALKSQDISPLTLLAGISGTGKSELPRLYADAGGISFLPVAVQPNWDSPADLFGFYNYTEGIFHSTPLCRALHQFTSNDGQAPSMHDRLLMVLLDEMNLARVEYYFSDLLSRLEIRRGILRNEGKPDDEQWRRASVELNLGEDSPVWLRLGANVLFVGTLNQDETTLDLSPKVVDRANTITFPKPSSFVDMHAVSSGSIVSPTQLSRKSWDKWCEASADLKKKVEQELRKKFDTVGSALEKVGRGVGQRVFQAAMRYVALYPADPAKSRDGIEIAIEDQFAMKLIPKLKGIDTRSKRGKECLDLFEGVVPDRLRKAFLVAKSDEIFEWRGADHMFELENEA